MTGAITKFHSRASRQFVFELFVVTLVSDDLRCSSSIADDVRPLLNWISEGLLQADFPFQRPFSASFTRFVSTRLESTDSTQLDFARCSRTKGLCGLFNFLQLCISTLLVHPKIWEATLCQDHRRFGNFWKWPFCDSRRHDVLRAARFHAYSKLRTFLDHFLS